jgi:hypothetical protein
MSGSKERAKSGKKKGKQQKPRTRRARDKKRLPDERSDADKEAIRQKLVARQAELDLKESHVHKGPFGAGLSNSADATVISYIGQVRPFKRYLMSMVNLGTVGADATPPCRYLDSLLILQDDALKNSPPVDAAVAAEYVRSRYLEMGTPMLKPDETPLMDGMGQEVTAIGGWRDPGTVVQFCSALTSVHVNKGQDGDYVESCNACIEKVNNQQDTQYGICGCPSHLNLIRHRNVGNPCKSLAMHTVKTWAKSSHRLGYKYEPESTEALRARDLAPLRAHLMNVGTLEAFTTWVRN